MFKHFVTILTLFSICALPLGPLSRANTTSPVTVASAREGRAACASCSGGCAQETSPLERLENLATLGRRTQVAPFAPLSRSTFEGANINFVNTATGSLAFAVTDLELPGLLPLVFQRAYSSDRQEDSGLGVGWSFAFDDRIALDGDTAVMTTGSGARLAFRRDGQSERFVLATDEPIPHQAFHLTEADTISEEAGGLTRTYRSIGALFRLSRIADPNGNQVNISFDAQGNIARVSGAGGADERRVGAARGATSRA